MGNPGIQSSNESKSSFVYKTYKFIIELLVAGATIALAIYAMVSANVANKALDLQAHTEAVQHQDTLAILDQQSSTEQIQHGDTLASLKQNESAQEIQFRAYLSITSDIVGPNNLTSDSNGGYQLNYTIKNDGITPANNLHATILLILPTRHLTVNLLNNGLSAIGPGEPVNEHDLLPNGTLNAVPLGGEDYLEINIQYTDYKGNKHSSILDGQFQRTSQGIITQLFTIRSRYQ